MPWIRVCERCGAQQTVDALDVAPGPQWCGCEICREQWQTISDTLAIFLDAALEAFWTNQPQPPLPELWNNRGVNPDLVDTAATLGGPGPGVTPAEARQQLLDGGWPLPANVMAKIEADREAGWEQDARQYRGTLAGATNKPTDR